MTKTHDLLVGKEWRRSAHTIPIINPFTEEVFAEVCLADATEIEHAIDLAEKSFKKTGIQKKLLPE